MAEAIIKKKSKKHDTTRTRLSPLTVILLVVLSIYVLSMFVLLFWALITSFKSQQEFRINIIGLPEKFVWNYSFVFSKFVYPISTESGTVNVGMPMMFLNSFLYAIGCAFAATITPCITAYLCAKFDYKFSKFMVVLVIVVMALPIVGNLPSEIMVAKAVGLFDHIWGLWLMRANFLGMYFLVFLNAFKAIPKDFTEAAKIDGAGNFTILFRIMLPLVRNTFFVVMLIHFIGFWNDYQVPLIYLPSHPTVALGVFNMATTKENGLSTIPMRMTGSMLMLIPILIIFIIFQKKLVGNLSVGGVKG